MNGRKQKASEANVFKASCLEKMFVQKGEKRPRLRLAGFEGDWKITTLGSCFVERIERSKHGELLSVTQSAGIRRFSELSRHDTSNIESGNYKVVKIGDIVYNSMRMWQGASGYSPYDGIVSPAYTVVVPQDGVSSSFFAVLFKSNEMLHDFRINSQGLTSDTWNLKFPIFSKIKCVIPPSIVEQEAISSFFEDLDKLIELQAKKVEKLHHIKAGCLERMFG